MGGIGSSIFYMYGSQVPLYKGLRYITIMENECEYVCSRGLLKSTDVHSKTPVSCAKTLQGYDANHVYKRGESVYICTKALRHFSIPTVPIVLVLGDTDIIFPQDCFYSENEMVKFIQNPNILHIFAQNCCITHPKVTRMPIGMDYHTSTIMSPVKQENELKSIIELSMPFYSRKMMCYSNFHFLMNTRFADDRRDAIKNVPSKLVYYEPKKTTRTKTWIKQAEYAFVLSPHGNGLDCHRTWEALLLGCIPVVKTSGIDKLYEGLPVLIVAKWEDVTEDLLTKTVEEYKLRFGAEFHKLDKLKLGFWTAKFAER